MPGMKLSDGAIFFVLGSAMTILARHFSPSGWWDTGARGIWLHWMGLLQMGIGAAVWFNHYIVPAISRRGAFRFRPPGEE